MCLRVVLILWTNLLKLNYIVQVWRLVEVMLRRHREAEEDKVDQGNG